MSLNVHHLEVFFHVAKHESVSRAAEAMRREQPTVSALIGDLEDSLGDVRLFHRRPFLLTAQGKELFEAIRPFFTSLPQIEERIRGGDVIRIGASPIILRDHLPLIEKRVRRSHPGLRLFLREGSEPQLLRNVERGDIDLAISLKPEQAPPKVTVDLLELTLAPALLIPKRHKARTAQDILQKDPLEPLVALPPDEPLMRHFAEWLRRNDLIWRPSVEVTSLDLLQRFVLRGYGVGLTVRRPDAALPAGLKELPMPDFPSIELALLYRDQGNKPLFHLFIAETKKHAARWREKGQKS